MLQCNPYHLIGLALFEHQVAYRHHTFNIDIEDHKISFYLDIEVQGKHQEDIMAHDLVKRIQHNIMWEIGALGSTERLTQRKLDGLGYVKSHCCFINDPIRIERLQSKIALVKLLEAAKNVEDKEATNNKKKEEGEFAALFPEAVQI